MNSEIIKILTLQIASIISPVILSVVLLILSYKKNAVSNTLKFFLGSVLIAIIVTVIGFSIGYRIGPPNIHEQFGKSVDLVFSIVFLVLAIKILLSKNENNKTDEKTNQNSNYFKMGLMLNIVNISSITALLAASKEIPLAHLDMITIILLIIFGLICFTIPIIIPLCIYLIFPQTAQKILDPINKFFNKYSKYIVSAIFFIFAIYFIYEIVSSHL